MILSTLTKVNRIFLKNLFARNMGHWNKDYFPGPYPTTETQRVEAAKKYNIHVTEYEPYPDDGNGCGDYPKLPVLGDFAKDPFYPWDNPEIKRNFMDPMHEDYEAMREDTYDAGRKFHRPIGILWLQTIFSSLFMGYILMCPPSLFYMFHALTAAQFPEEGKTHYTFDSCAEDSTEENQDEKK